MFGVSLSCGRCYECLCKWDLCWVPLVCWLVVLYYRWVLFLLLLDYALGVSGYFVGCVMFQLLGRWSPIATSELDCVVVQYFTFGWAYGC